MKKINVQLILLLSLYFLTYNLSANDINISGSTALNQQKIDLLEKEIGLLKNENIKLKIQLDNEEDKRQDSISNLNNRIESFGNFLTVANNKTEKNINLFSILITIFGALMTLLVIYFAFKSTKEAKNLAEDWLEKEAKNHVDKTKLDIDNYVKNIKKDSERIENLVEEYKYKVLIEDDDIEMSIENKEILNQEVKAIKMKALSYRTFQDNLKIIFYHIAYKNYDEAENHIDLLIPQYETNFELSRLYYLRGIIADKQDNEKETIKYLEASILKAKNYSDPYRQLAHFYSTVKKDYTKAIDFFKKAINENPYDYKAYARMGVAYRHINHIEDARKCYNKAIEINPDSRIAYNNLGFLYLLNENYNDAIKNFKYAIKVDPDSSIVSYNNIFRIQLITIGNIDNQLEKEYLLKFKDKDLDHFSSYELYKILFKIIKNESIEADLREWKNKYKGKKFRQFSLKKLREWAKEYDNKKIHIKLIKVIDDISIDFYL